MGPLSFTRDVAFATVADVCAFVDELDPSESGELVTAEGTVFVDGGRICWAAARGLAPRLTQLLVERSGVDAATMEGFYRTCKARRVPLGEHLVGAGIITAEALRAALAQHTIESLVAVTRTGRRAGWNPRPPASGGYSARFTFGTAEILARAGGLAEGAAARIAEAEMTASLSDGDWAAAFVRSPSRSVPEPIALVGEGPASAAALLRVARWAASALDLVAAFEGERPMIAVKLPKGAPSDVRVAFEHAGVLVVGETGALGPARILNRRAVARRTKG